MHLTKAALTLFVSRKFIQPQVKFLFSVHVHVLRGRGLMETKATDTKSKLCIPQGNEHTISLSDFLQKQKLMRMDSMSKKLREGFRNVAPIFSKK